jgi:glycosyltransferase involved in cell wall biosynthesis
MQPKTPGVFATENSRPTLITVIMAVKNGERFLSPAIQSVLAQESYNIEILLIDGQSHDRTAEIARSYPQIRYIYQSNQGIANAYNLGIEHADGDIIAFLSHDDLWTPDKLSVQVGYLLSHPEIQYTIAHVKFFLEPGYTLPPGFRPHLLAGEHVGQIMETLVARREVFATVGEFNPQLSTAEDVDWFARASDLKIPMAVLDKVLLHKRVHDTNLSLNAPENTRNLLAALRASMQRKRSGHTL